jgi:hypothetical protein
MEADNFMAENNPRLSDEETLYRGVADDELFFPVDVNGVRRISHMAFNDRTCRPSVDIASRCNNDPNYTANSRGPGVLQITAGQVRSISSTREVVVEGKKATALYTADVCAEPVEDNPAHGVIYGKPPFDSGSLFKRIKESLANESKWVIPPSKWTKENDK